MNADMMAFNKIRNYYREHHINGNDDESFLVWCEAMCKVSSTDHPVLTYLTTVTNE